MDFVTGSVVKANDENRFLLLVAYSPNEMPHRGADGFIDVVSHDVLEKACWKFMDNGAKVGLWHEKGTEHCGRVVENYVYRGPDWSFNNQVVKAGTWLVGVICCLLYT